ncbi:discoidin domain-containing protein [Paractinoplanes lichenicola]|uniref:Discoidin domain-containing protein n=1 Tax=Paractinoplanes lichenicola TaxID=2802976 RepID=A0ABS1VH86_9ACTN|nr:discoidin domain-containing protein [Actinoplanes lichenicola]MBL7254064.1 discoidin domain-containing protein [Actinoplanes lichenicola]
MPDVRPRGGAAPPPATAPPAPPPARRRSRKGWWAASGLITAVLLAGGLYVAYRATTEKAVPAPSVPSLAVPTASAVATEAVLPPSAPPSRAVAAPVTSVPKSSPKVTAAAKANPSGANLALTGVVAASSIEAPHFGAAEAVDGDPASRWSSGFAEPQWLRVDLRERRTLTEVKLVWEHAHATAYRVEVSLDGKTWRRIFATTAGAGGTVTVDAGGTVARFVRMYGTKRSNQYGFSLWEFEVR